jgi:hypothetical protein
LLFFFFFYCFPFVVIRLLHGILGFFFLLAYCSSRYIYYTIFSTLLKFVNQLLLDDGKVLPVHLDENGQPLSSSKKRPVMVLRRFPIIPRLQRLFMSQRIAHNMRWHAEGRTKDGVLRHPADVEAWKSFDNLYPDFSSDSRNVRLGLTLDGFNPFANMSTSHSTWPIILVLYNLMPWMCKKQTSFILCRVIPSTTD